jgi:hypothetical protein
MDDNIHSFRNRILFDFEDHFNYQEISPEKISFARHYIESIMGIDLSSDSYIEFTSIRATVFGYLVAHIALEYEEYIKGKPEAGFITSSPDEL